ncbi:MAG: Cobalt-zinc-cadmium efflux system protein [Gemmatimonadetes bacterium]|nr:Cobalt-zinc-cadmium efflux system protein [Gemmatimonadota bacterium]
MRGAREGLRRPAGLGIVDAWRGGHGWGTTTHNRTAGMGAGHHHHHGHAHGHSHGVGAQNVRRLTITLVLAALYMVAEAVGGWLAHSLALLADAGHMLSDVAALGLSLFAMRIAQKPPTPQRTYGFYRTEILAALANASTLIAISIWIFVEAYHRFRHPGPVGGVVMVAVSLGGLAVNLAAMRILHGGREESLNVRGVWLHFMTDALGCVGGMVGGGLVWALGWTWADPLISVLIGVLVIYSSWALMKESVAVLLEGTPPHIDVGQVRDAILQVDGVCGVHDLHVWTITSGMEAMSGHVVLAQDEDERSRGTILSQLQAEMHRRFGLHHLTIQIEPADFASSRCAEQHCR